MPKTTEQLLASKAGETAESNGFGSQERPLRPAGLYELKNDAGEVVDRLIVKVHPKFGDSQAAAVERVGYKFVRAAKPEEVKQIEVDATKLATENTSVDKGTDARLTLLEQESKKKDEQIASLLAELNKGKADDEVKTASKENAKAAAEEQTEARGQGSPLDDAKPAATAGEGEKPADEDDEGDEGNDEGDGEGKKEKTFAQLNRAELEELAEKEGIELPAEADTNAKIREVITKARAEKEGN